MGTYEPDPELLRAQIESVRTQTDTRWVCVISDDHSSPERFAELTALVRGDARFIVSQAPQRCGFYRNFERALGLAPPEAELIAFCDQDDVWYPDKLAVLRAAIGDATLVYSDMRLVDADGVVLRETLWQGRHNNRTDLASMLIANTVTGSASLFRREVAELALPFPDCPGLEFHDHWLALVALASGELAYVDRPLYDYVQHRRAVVGKGPDASAPAERRRLVRKPRLSEWRAAYFLGYLPGEIRARTLLLRCGERLSDQKRRGLERYLAAGRTARGLLWLIARPGRAVTGHTETLAGEWALALGVVWLHLARLVARVPGWPDRLTLDTRFPDQPILEHRRLQRWREQSG
jgi:glycosyltransferase involved in cell wall biosynthesis